MQRLVRLNRTLKQSVCAGENTAMTYSARVE